MSKHSSIPPLSAAKVSILIPIFNVEKYLEQCLDSVINQTLKDIEIICINDGSTDSSPNIIKKYAKQDSRIIVINKKNSGYGDSMNKGLKKATGEYIGIVESDDWVELDAFEQLYALAKNNKAEVVKANFYNYFTSPKKLAKSGSVYNLVNDTEANKIINTTAPEHGGIFWQQPAIWTAIYDREFLQKNHIEFLPTPGASYQDTGFNFKVWANATRAFFTTKAFLHYRQDNENSSINNPKKVFCVSDEYAEIEKYLKDHSLFEKFKNIMYSAKWGGYKWNIDRLDPKLAKDFIDLAHKEYLEAYNNGDFTFAHCDSNAYRALSELINSPKTTLQCKIAQAKAKVSIIVPIYNVEQYLEKCLDSAIDQSLDDIEIILVDDGSTDTSADIAETYYQKDARIQLINKPNGGQSSARNVGIAKSHAPFLMFLDSDDCYFSTSVETLYNNITNNPVDLAIGGTIVVYLTPGFTAEQKNNDRQYYQLKQRGVSTITDKFIKQTDVSVWNKIWKRSVLEQYDIVFPEGLLYEDAYFFNAYAMVAAQAFFDSTANVYNYVRRNGSTMSLTFSKTTKAYDHTEIIFKLYDFAKKYKLLHQQEDRFVYLFNTYVDLSLRYLPDSSIGFLHERLVRFTKTHASDIANETPALQLVLDKFIKQTTTDKKDSEPLTSPRSAPLRHRVKKPMKRLLTHLPSYRNEQRILNDVSIVSHQLENLQNQQRSLEQKIDKLADLLQRSR